jgi:hypothetical protein
MSNGWSRYSPIAFCLLFGIAVTFAITRKPAYPIYEYRNVKVLSQVSPNKWWIEREDGKTLYTGCNDFDNEAVIWPGYVAKRVKYEDHGNCNSILAPGLGFFWDRDSKGNVREIR